MVDTTRKWQKLYGDIMRICKHCNEPFTRPIKGLQCNSCRNGRTRYGMGRIQMKEMLEEQFNECMICHNEIWLGTENEINTKKYQACVDHDHKTKKVRGILCHPCNTQLGWIENNNINLDDLKKYLNMP